MAQEPAPTPPLPERIDEAVPDAAATPVSREEAGRYQLRREFGRGGQAIVWLAFDEHIGREVAFKQLLPEQARRGKPAQRFLREARVTGQLEHPSIVPVYELGVRADGSHYYTQKLVRGRNLYEALYACKGLGERLRLLPHFVDVCQAVAYAHDKGVIHRDLKPENVMVGEFGETVVLDWGLAKVRGQVEGEGPHLSDPLALPASQTQAGTVLGTPLYMSPEQARGELHLVDEKSDVWSLGAMLFEILSGHPPFDAKSSDDVIKRLLNDPLPKLREEHPEAPPELVAVAERALQKERTKRYASARELAADVTAWTSGARVRAYEYSSWELVKKFVARNKALTAVVAGAVLLLAGATVVIALEGKAARENLAVARKNLAEAFAEKARSAADDVRWSRAAAYFAAARAQDDSSPSSWGEALAEARAERPAATVDPGLSAVSALLPLPGGRLLLGGNAGELQLWIAQPKPARLASLAALREQVAALAASADGSLLAAAGLDGTVQLWDGNTLAPLRTIAASKDELWAAALSPDGKVLAAGGLDLAVHLFDARTGAPLGDLTGHRERVAGLAFLRDGRLASASFDGSVRLWARDAGGRFAEDARLDTANTRFWSLAVSPDGMSLAAGGSEGALRLWRPDAHPPLMRLAGQTSTVAAVAFSPDGQLVAGAAWDGSVMVWEAATGAALLSIAAHDRPASGVAFLGERTLYSAAEDGLLRSFALPAGTPLANLRGHKNDVRALAFAPDGKVLASAGADGSVRLWDTATRRQLRELRLSAWARAVDFSADGRLLAAGCDDQRIHILDAKSWRELHALEGHTDEIWSVRFAPAGALLASSANDGTIRLWDAAAGKVVRTIAADQGKVRAVDFSPDGTLLASAGTDETARIFHVATGVEKQQLRGHLEHLRAVAFSRDGKLVATAGNDRRVLVYDAATGKLVHALSGHEGQVRGVAFTPAGLVASASADRTLRLWDPATGAELVQLLRQEDELLSLALSRDGSLVASAGRDGVIGLARLAAPDGRAPAESLSATLAAHGLRLNGLKLEEELDARRAPKPEPHKGRSARATAP